MKNFTLLRERKLKKKEKNRPVVLVSNLFYTRLPCVERRLDDFLLILSIQEYENIVEVVANIESIKKKKIIDLASYNIVANISPSKVGFSDYSRFLKILIVSIF